MKTVNDFWQSYKHHVVPENAGIVQQEETLKSFYAGCHAVMALIRANPCVETFNQIELELEVFMADLGSKHDTTH